jgi:uncharacterized protein YhfF
MNIPDSIQSFWKDFETAVGQDVSERFYEAFHFDDNEADANSLAELVLQGTKRATAGLLWSNEAENKPIPKVGDMSVVTDWSGNPLCVIETTLVEIVPYEDVDENFAATEGEGDGSLRHWKEVHWKYFSRECERIGKKPSHQMPIVCECFKVVYPKSD